jgi:hypothetical protein
MQKQNYFGTHRTILQSFWIDTKEQNQKTEETPAEWYYCHRQSSHVSLPEVSWLQTSPNQTNKTAKHSTTTSLPILIVCNSIFILKLTVDVMIKTWCKKMNTAR